jgi:hypothetical protein
MGGFGTWHTAQAYPELFAAIVPICGGGNPHTAWKLENMPVWCFHGAKDNVVEIARSQEMIDSLKAYNSSDVKFTIYPEAGHDSWTEAYNNEDVYRWMLSHKRFKYEELPIRVELLNEYAGTYTNENARIQVNVRDNGLTVVVPGDEAYAYKYAGNDNFFRDADNFKLIKFNRDKNNKITEFSLYQGQYEVVFFK